MSFTPVFTDLMVTTTLVGSPGPTGSQPSGKIAPAIGPLFPGAGTTWTSPFGLSLLTVVDHAVGGVVLVVVVLVDYGVIDV